MPLQKSRRVALFVWKRTSGVFWNNKLCVEAQLLLTSPDRLVILIGFPKSHFGKKVKHHLQRQTECFRAKYQVFKTDEVKNNMSELWDWRHFSTRFQNSSQMYLKWSLLTGVRLHAFVWCYLLQNLDVSEDRGKKKNQHKPHTFALSLAATREDRCDYLHNG